MLAMEGLFFAAMFHEQQDLTASFTKKHKKHPHNESVCHFNLDFDRKSDCKCRALTYCALNRYRSMMRVHNILDNGKT